MGAHINKDGLWQSDKYPSCPPGKVPLSVKDATAQDLLWKYAQRRRAVDAEFSEDLEAALRNAGFVPPSAPAGEHGAAGDGECTCFTDDSDFDHIHAPTCPRSPFDKSAAPPDASAPDRFEQRLHSIAETFMVNDWGSEWQTEGVPALMKLLRAQWDEAVEACASKRKNLSGFGYYVAEEDIRALKGGKP